MEPLLTSTLEVLIMSRLENLKMFEGSISGNLTNVSFSCGLRLVISIIPLETVS